MNRERIRSFFLGSKLRIVGTILLSLVLVVALGFLLGIFGVPAVQEVENSFGDVNETTTVIETRLAVSNPNPIGLKLGGSNLEYTVSMNDIYMAEGSYADLGVGSGNSTLNFTSYMRNSRIPDWWASHVRNGEHTLVAVDATVHSSLLPMSVAGPDIERDVNTNITAAFNSTRTRPIAANQPIVSDPVLYVNETSGSWGEVTAQRTEIDMRFRMYNPKSYPIAASRIGYNMTMNDVRIGEGETNSSVTIPPRSTREVVATTTIDNERLDQWWVSHLVRNQRTNLTIDFYAEIDAASVFDTIRIPLEEMTTSFETDIFGNKESEGGGDDADGETDDGSMTDVPTAPETPGDGSDLIGGTDTPAAGGGTDTTADDGSGAGTTTDDDGGTNDGGGDSTTSTPTPTPTDGGGLLG